MAELAASHASRQTVVTDRDLFVHEFVGESIGTFSHRSDENTDALVRLELLHVFSDLHDFCVKTERDLAAVWWEMIGDRVLDRLQQLLLGVR